MTLDPHGVQYVEKKHFLRSEKAILRNSDPLEPYCSVESRLLKLQATKFSDLVSKTSSIPLKY